MVLLLGCAGVWGSCVWSSVWVRPKPVMLGGVFCVVGVVGDVGCVGVVYPVFGSSVFIFRML